MWKKFSGDISQWPKHRTFLVSIKFNNGLSIYSIRPSINLTRVNEYYVIGYGNYNDDEKINEKIIADITHYFDINYPN